tara:strand:- start:10873 stop:12990 length:2118 start_codon:yes stop_codon:yes gene_type:complete
MSEEINVNINVKGADKGAKDIKDLSKNTKDATKNTENLTDATKDAWGEVSIMGISLKSVKAGFVSASTSAKAMFSSVKAGLISTGIGVFVIAIGSLIAYFTQSERGAEQMKVALAFLGGIMTKLTDTAIMLGEWLVKLFTDPVGALKDLGNAIIENIMNRLEAVVNYSKGVAKVLKGVFTMDWKSVKEGANESAKAMVQLTTGMDMDKVAKFGDELMKTANAMANLEKRTNKLKDSNRDLNVEFAERRAEIEELKMIAEDLSKNEETRLKATQDAFAIEQELLDKRVANAEEELRIQQETMALGENVEEDLDREAQLMINLANIRQESATKQIELNNKLNSIKREIDAKDKTSHDEFVRQENEKKKLIQDRIKANQDVLAGLETAFMNETELRDHNALKLKQQQEASAKQLLDDTRQQQQALLDAGTITAEQMRATMKEANATYGEQMSDILLLFNDSTNAFEITVDVKKEKLLQTLAEMGYDLEQFEGFSKEMLQKQIDENTEFVEGLKERNEKLLASAQSFLNSFSSLQQTTAQNNMNALQEQYDNGTISQEEFEKKKENIEADALKKQKRMAMIQLAVDTASAISSAVAGATASATGTGPLAVVSQPLFIATMLTTLFGAFATAKGILSQVPGGGGGGGGGNNSPSPTNTSGLMSQFDNMLPNTLSETMGTDENEPIQAYVVETDISDAQALQEEIDLQTTL